MWHKIITKINRIVENITALLLALMVLAVFVQIVSRALFNMSFPWTEELARYLMIWVTFLGASFAFQYGAHISIEAFVTRLKQQWSQILHVIVAIVCTAFFFILILKGIEMMDRSMIQRSAALGIPMGYVYSVIPLSGCLMILNLIDVTMKALKQPEQTDSTKKGIEGVE
ncbi:TRAP transporter small permease [Geomicrobium sp. JCM 19038]|uniref:TRAP transporter small permease n=1 Tax=Geomicrobium sp. JCM 19038 TaxID=1460635 RepID=UPI00045F2AFB|nr:TRAP transporter small permease [Geomicrobium sp. JCM 19038]GAK07336.1 TRAP-type transport system, small permease component, predicted N-acetylneuraminate transporter [Geomicrobium sp. JCM 19038]